MKNLLKSISSIVMSAAIAASAGAIAAVPAFAADHSIAVTKPAADEAEHKYIAYQVFTGNLSNDGTMLTEIVWGTGVKSDELLTALKASTAFGAANPFASCTTAAQVAVELEKFSASSPEANAFADIVSANLSETSYDLTSGKVPDKSYYFIKDTITSSPATNDHYAYSDHILRVVTDKDLERVESKSDVPSLEKKIGDDFKTGKNANAASIGDKVPFVLESKVPDMARYNDYYFIVNDTMSDGLTFNNDVQITVGDYELKEGADFTVDTTNASPYTFQIIFKNFYEQLYLNNTPDDITDDGKHIGEVITVKYSATLNEKADITSVGNPNKSVLTFSNNPNHKYEGGDKPTDEEKNNKDVVGKTPESYTKTFTTGIKLIKKDATTKELLEGAKFQITGNGVKAVLINGQIYKKSTEGTHYMLKDGTFTPDAPTSATEDKYDSTSEKYILVNKVTKDTAPETASVNQTAYSDANGVISFVGLGDGTYTITELEAPDKYNKLTNNIIINIKSDLDDTNKTCTWTVSKDGTNIGQTDNLYTFDVENNKGMTLPSTGGIGTTIFYVVGAFLVAGALVLLITKKRMNIKEK